MAAVPRRSAGKSKRKNSADNRVPGWAWGVGALLMLAAVAYVAQEVNESRPAPTVVVSGTPQPAGNAPAEIIPSAVPAREVGGPAVPAPPLVNSPTPTDAVAIPPAIVAAILPPSARTTTELPASGDTAERLIRDSLRVVLAGADAIRLIPRDQLAATFDRLREEQLALVRRAAAITPVDRATWVTKVNEIEKAEGGELLANVYRVHLGLGRLQAEASASMNAAAKADRSEDTDATMSADAAQDARANAAEESDPDSSAANGVEAGPAVAILRWIRTVMATREAARWLLVEPELPTNRLEEIYAAHTQQLRDILVAFAGSQTDGYTARLDAAGEAYQAAWDDYLRAREELLAAPGGVDSALAVNAALHRYFVPRNAFDLCLVSHLAASAKDSPARVAYTSSTASQVAAMERLTGNSAEHRLFDCWKPGKLLITLPDPQSPEASETPEEFLKDAIPLMTRAASLLKRYDAGGNSEKFLTDAKKLLIEQRAWVGRVHRAFHKFRVQDWVAAYKKLDANMRIRLLREMDAIQAALVAFETRAKESALPAGQLVAESGLLCHLLLEDFGSFKSIRSSPMEISLLSRCNRMSNLASLAIQPSRLEPDELAVQLARTLLVLHDGSAIDQRKVGLQLALAKCLDALLGSPEWEHNRRGEVSLRQLLLDDATREWERRGAPPKDGEFRLDGWVESGGRRRPRCVTTNLKVETSSSISLRKRYPNLAPATPRDQVLLDLWTMGEKDVPVLMAVTDRASARSAAVQVLKNVIHDREILTRAHQVELETSKEFRDPSSVQAMIYGVGRYESLIKQVRLCDFGEEIAPALVACVEAREALRFSVRYAGATPPMGKTPYQKTIEELCKKCVAMEKAFAMTPDGNLSTTVGNLRSAYARAFEEWKAAVQQGSGLSGASLDLAVIGSTPELQGYTQFYTSASDLLTAFEKVDRALIALEQNP